MLEVHARRCLVSRLGRSCLQASCTIRSALGSRCNSKPSHNGKQNTLVSVMPQHHLHRINNTSELPCQHFSVDALTTARAFAMQNLEAQIITLLTSWAVYVQKTESGILVQMSYECPRI